MFWGRKEARKGCLGSLYREMQKGRAQMRRVK